MKKNNYKTNSRVVRAIKLISLIMMPACGAFAIDSSCVRHFYNYTSQTQLIDFDMYSDTSTQFLSSGEVTIFDNNNNAICSVYASITSGIFCSSTADPQYRTPFTTNHPYMIMVPANTTYSVEYYYGGGYMGEIDTQVDLPGGFEPALTVTNFSGPDTALWQCPYIEHVGNTGLPTVNDPANGDIYWGNPPSKAKSIAQ